METLRQVCSGIAAAAFLVGSGAAFAAARLGETRARWAWRGGVLIGIGALLLGSILPSGLSEGELPLLSRVGGRAILMALLAGLSIVSSRLGDYIRQRRQPTVCVPFNGMAWAELIPGAVVAGIGVVSWASETLATTMPILLLCTLVTAGLALWSSGQGLDVLMGEREDNRRAAAVVFVGLTVSVIMVGGVNWRVWGMPGGNAVASVSLLAVWLLGAARLVLQRTSVWLPSLLDSLIAALLVVIALRVQWTWPFG